MSDSDQSFETVYFSSSDGLRLSARDYGRDQLANRENLPVVCLPGLTRNARDFHQLADALSCNPKVSRRVIALDYRGRGLSDWDKNAENYNILKEAEDVLTACTVLGVKDAAFIGTSRGALILHLLGAMRPGMMKALVLNDAGPQLDGAGLVLIKSYLSRKDKPKSMTEAAEILKDIHGKPFNALTDTHWAEMADAIYRDIDGKIVADFDPAIAAALSAIDFNVPLPTLWPQFTGLSGIPMLTIRGENSKLLTEDLVSKMQDAHPQMEVLIAKGQGHAPILHVPAVLKGVQTFLNKQQH